MDPRRGCEHLPKDRPRISHDDRYRPRRRRHSARSVDSAHSPPERSLDEENHRADRIELPTYPPQAQLPWTFSSPSSFPFVAIHPNRATFVPLEAVVGARTPRPARRYATMCVSEYNKRPQQSPPSNAAPGIHRNVESSAASHPLQGSRLLIKQMYRHHSPGTCPALQRCRVLLLSGSRGHPQGGYSADPDRLENGQDQDDISQDERQDLALPSK